MDLDLKEIILEQRPEQRRTSSFICIFAGIQKRVDTSRKLTENGKIWSWWLKRGELLKSVPYVF